MKNQIIVGAGEIGHCVSKIVQGLTFFHDPAKNLFARGQTGVLHICYPCTDQQKFIADAVYYIGEFKADLVFIHSTVPVGTTDKLIEAVKGQNKRIIFTPVRGRHQTLPYHVQAFTKYFAPALQEDEKLIRSVFPFISAIIYKDAKSVEFAKIMCTTYLGWCLLYEKEMYRLCKEHGLDYVLAYQSFNVTYNEKCNDEVYPKIFARPIYQHMEGPIGGHCVMPNLELEDNFITKTIKEYFDGTEST
jgi:UDP-N-acetyl-D-mannosaminuronate dehydrogenase